MQRILAKSNLRSDITDLKGYGDKLDANLREGERGHTAAEIQEEILSDLTGDALADPEFLQKLADDNPGMFRKLLKNIIHFLSKAASKLRGTGVERYVEDIEVMREHLRTALNDYAKNKSITAETGKPDFMVAWHGSAPTSTFIGRVNPASNENKSDSLIADTHTLSDFDDADVEIEAKFSRKDGSILSDDRPQQKPPKVGLFFGHFSCSV